MALLKNSRKQQKNAAKAVISKNKMLQSKSIGKKKAASQQNNAAIGAFVRKNKRPSKAPKASSSKSSRIKPS
jgi:hypothetical protein